MIMIKKRKTLSLSLSLLVVSIIVISLFIVNQTKAFPKIETPINNLGNSIEFTYRDPQIIVVADNSGSLVINNQWTTPIIVTKPDNSRISVPGISSSGEISVETGDVIGIDESSFGVTFREWRPHYDLGTCSAPVDGNIGLVSDNSGTTLAHISKIPPMNAFTTDETGETAGANFFAGFNRCGMITSYPDGSFDTSGILHAGKDFFSYFNHRGNALSELPDGSFNISNIETVSHAFFHAFNSYSKIAHFPDGSFQFPKITTPDTFFFRSFNYAGEITSLPTGSFDTSNLTSLTSAAFGYFNYEGGLTSLPTGSFQLTQIPVTTISGDPPFFNFNGSSAATTGKLGSSSASTLNISNRATSSLYVWKWNGTTGVRSTWASNVNMAFDSL